MGLRAGGVSDSFPRYTGRADSRYSRWVRLEDGAEDPGPDWHPDDHDVQEEQCLERGRHDHHHTRSDEYTSKKVSDEVGGQ